MTDETAGSGWDLSPEQRVLWFIDFAEEQIRDLLPYVTGQQGISPPAVQAACKESFLLNVRLIIDFLTRGDSRRDVLAAHFAPDWAPDGELKTRLDDWHALASRHAMHLSKERVPDDVGSIQPVEAEHYRRMAADCAEALASFRQACAPNR
ncbi:hypothetical protein [Streptomyces sp. NPDC059176]|uniref:hypothetical protein n=1 Tax=Streptomyces sp. NPDC059176 TaxID=3346758 RepID=UPI0036A0D6DC